MWNTPPLPESDWNYHKLDSTEDVDVNGIGTVWPHFDEALAYQDATLLNPGSWHGDIHGNVDPGLSPVLSYESQNSRGLTTYPNSDVVPIPPGLDLSFIDPVWHVADPSDVPTQASEVKVTSLGADAFSPAASYAASCTGERPTGMDIGLPPVHDEVTVRPNLYTFASGSVVHYSHLGAGDSGSSADQPGLDQPLVPHLPRQTMRPVPQPRQLSLPVELNTATVDVRQESMPHARNASLTGPGPLNSPHLQRRYVSLAPSPIDTSSVSNPALHTAVPLSESREGNSFVQPQVRREDAPFHGITVSSATAPVVMSSVSLDHSPPQYTDGRLSYEYTSDHAGLAINSSATHHARTINPREGQSVPELDEGRHRNHPLYSQSPEDDGLYHCPFVAESNCQHKPTKLKCNYDKFIDSHLKPFRCKLEACSKLEFSSTACLLRHEREAHGMHGHGERPHLCYYTGCDRGLPGNGFPRRYNLFDHMKRVHNHHMTKEAEAAQSEPRKPPTNRKRKDGPNTTSAPPSKQLKHVDLQPQRSLTANSSVGGLVSPPLMHADLDYSQVANKQKLQAEDDQRLKYSRWINQKDIVARQVDFIHGPDDEVNLQQLSQNISELQRLSEEVRQG